MSNELVVIEPKNAMTLFTETDQLNEILKQVEMEVVTFEHDLSNDARRKKTASLARKVASTKTYLDGLGKDLVADWKSKSKAVDANRKMMRDRLDELRDLARKPLTDWEAEDARIKAEEAAAAEAARVKLEIDNANELALMMNDNFDRELAEKLAEEERQRVETARIAEEQRIANEQRIAEEAAAKAIADAEAKAKAEAERYEREKAEAARRELEATQRAEQAERDRVAAEERAKVEAEQAEARRIQWEKDEETRRIAAQEQAKRDAEEAAQRARDEEIARRQAEEQRIAEEAAAREANKKHKAAVNNEMLNAFVAAGLAEDQAKLAVIALAKQEIPHIGKIQY